MTHYYRSKPTKTEVRITSNALDATIGNFTFKLTLPISEIHSASSLTIWASELEDGPLSCQSDHMSNMEHAYYFSSECLPVHLIPLIKSYNPQIVPDIMFLRNMLCKIIEDPLNRTYTHIVDVEQMMQNLNARFSERLQPIWEKMTTYDGNYVQNLSSAIRDFNNLMEENLDRDFQTHFLLLKMMSDEALVDDFPFVELFNATEFFRSSVLSPKETLEEISQRLLDIAPFVLPASLSGTEIFLRDWNIEFLSDQRAPLDNYDYLMYYDEYEFEQSYRKFGNSFTLEFQVRPPEGVQEFSMDINPPKQLIKHLFPFMHMDSWLYKQYRKEENTSQSFVYHLTACDIKDWAGDIDLSASEKTEEWLSTYFFSGTRTEFLEPYVYPAVDFYRRHSKLKIGAGTGHVTLKPFNKYHINQLPIGRMISQTDDCISLDFGDCLDLCQSNYTIEKCECYQWNVHYLHTQSDTAVCSQPCPGLSAQKDLCFLECEEMLAHPCDRIIYMPEISDQTPITSLEERSTNDHDIENGIHVLDNEFKLFSFKITIEKVITYAKTLESYEMTFTNFISEFGGLVDFWLGVNVIGIIHAFVYFIKQCCHCGRGHKTGRTMRQLVACSNSNTELRPIEQPIAAGIPIEMLATMQQIDRRLRETQAHLRRIEEKIVREHFETNKRLRKLEIKR